MSRSLHNKDHSVGLLVTGDAQGWHVRELDDAETVNDVVYSDWHRVERALRSFDRRATQLRDDGWIDDGLPSAEST